MKQPAEFARDAEEHPDLPKGDCERVSGYGVMGLPFASGHVLGLRRWTASSVGGAYTSVWHRDPEGRWTFYESAPSEVACSRYFGAGVERVEVVPIHLEWPAPHRLHVFAEGPVVDWTIDIGSAPVARAMSVAGSMLPMAAWRSRPVLRAMGYMAGAALRAGKVNLTGVTCNSQRFDANPLRIWYVTGSRALVEGEDLGPIGAVRDQARLGDFYLPQRGVFAMGRVFVTPLPAQGGAAATDVGGDVSEEVGQTAGVG